MKYILLENVKLVMCSELILGLPILKACCDGPKESERPLRGASGPVSHGTSKHICLCPSLPKLTLNDICILDAINVDFLKYLLRNVTREPQKTWQ